MSVEREYEIVLRSEPEGGFSVFVPELPSVATQGETMEEATEMTKEAIEVYLEVMHGDGLPIPTVHRGNVALTRRERRTPGGQPCKRAIGPLIDRPSILSGLMPAAHRMPESIPQLPGLPGTGG